MWNQDNSAPMCANNWGKYRIRKHTQIEYRIGNEYRAGRIYKCIRSKHMYEYQVYPMSMRRPIYVEDRYLTTVAANDVMVILLYSGNRYLNPLIGTDVPVGTAVRCWNAVDGNTVGIIVGRRRPDRYNYIADVYLRVGDPYNIFLTRRCEVTHILNTEYPGLDLTGYAVPSPLNIAIEDIHISPPDRVESMRIGSNTHVDWIEPSDGNMYGGHVSGASQENDEWIYSIRSIAGKVPTSYVRRVRPTRGGRISANGIWLLPVGTMVRYNEYDYPTRSRVRGNCRITGALDGYRNRYTIEDSDGDKEDISVSSIEYIYMNGGKMLEYVEDS